MQKKIIAAAIIGMVSAAASAATVYDKDGLKVSLGGKFDFAVQYQESEGLQTLSLKDGAYSTSRLTLGAEQAINSDLSAYYSVDLRFGSFYTGKNYSSTTQKGTTTAVVDAGLNTNDAKKGGLVSKKFGRIEAGTINVATQQFVFKKPYVNGQESELVKYGISQKGLEALSNRTIYMHTSNQLPVVLKGSYSISDNTATDYGPSGDMISAGMEFKGGIVNGGAATVVKRAGSYATNNKIQHSEGFLALEKNGKKVSFHMSADKARGATGGELKGMGFSLNAYYLIGDKWDLGIEGSRYVDQSEKRTKNSGKGYMYGVHYYAAKGVAFFGGVAMDNWQADQSVSNAKITGNKAAFIDSFSKKDSRTYSVGMNFSF